MLPNTNKISRFSILGGVASLLLLSFREANLFLPALWLLFMLLGNILYHDRTERNLFRINLNISLFLLPLFLWSYTLQTGKPFITGGDSEAYYNNFMLLLDGKVEINPRSRYILYYLVSWKYYAFMKFLTGSTSYLFLVLLTLFISANTAPLLYKIGRNENFKEQVLLSACLMTCVFPSLVERYIIIMREGFIIAPFLFSVYLSQKIKNTEGVGKLKYACLFLLTILWIGNIRFEISAIAILFFFLYNYVFTDKAFSFKNYVFLCGVAILAALFILPNIVGVQLTEHYDLSAKMESFDTQSLENVDSLTSSLRHRGFIGRFILFFYCAFMPVPPHVISNLSTPHYYLLAAGNVMWYFMLPVSMVGIFRNIKQKTFSGFSKSFLVIALVAILMLSLTLLGTERHKIYIYPIVFLFFFNYLSNTSKKKSSRLFIMIAILFMLLVSAYLIMKSI
jgi:hypothetical protein